MSPAVFPKLNEIIKSIRKLESDNVTYKVYKQ